MSREEIDAIKETLLARDYARDLFGDLEGFKRTGRKYMARCPFHADKTPSFSISTEEPVYNCFGCGAKGDWLTYLQERNGLTFPEALEKLAAAAGVELLGIDREALARQHKRGTVLEQALAYFQAALNEPGGKGTLDYLQARGYTLDEIKRMELGHYPGGADTAELLKTLSPGAGDAFPYLDARDDYRVVIPYRGPLGDVKSLWGRLTRKLKEGESEANKYKPHTADADKGTPFNLDRARRSAKFRDSGELLAVEGYFKALVIRERTGLDNVIALGGSSITEGQLETLRRYKAREIVLALDANDAGRKGTERAIEKLAGADIRAYVLELPDGPGPDDYIITRGDAGPGAFMELYAGRVSGLKWRAGRLVENYRNAQTDPERDRAKEGLLDLGAKAAQDPLSLKEYAQTLTGLGIPLEHASEWLEELDKKRAAEKLSRGSRELLGQALGRLDKGQALDLRELEDRVKDLRLEAEKMKARPTETLSEHLRAKHEREKIRKPGELLGYRLNRFENIAKNTDGIQSGFYFIGAYTNRGKTALATNLFLDLLQSNPETKGLYVSLDDNRDVIINRFLGISTGLLLNEVQREPAGAGEAEKIAKAYGDLIRLADAGRLAIKDISEISGISTLEIEIRERAEGKLFVFIDGLYNLETGGDYGGLREANVERAQRIKALVDTYKIPIIATGELRKPGPGKPGEPGIHDVMETGKIAYNANIVWLVTPADEGTFKELPEPVLTLKFEKNKLSDFTGELRLKFRKAAGKLIEDRP